MPVAQRFEDLTVWQRARALNKRVHKMTRLQPMRRDYAMVDQFRRASLSIMNNIAEGFDRFRRAEFLQYLSMAKGSAGEVRSMLYSALDAEYINHASFESMRGEAEQLGHLIAKFRSGLERSVPRIPEHPTTRRSAISRLRT